GLVSLVTRGALGRRFVEAPAEAVASLALPAEVQRALAALAPAEGRRDAGGLCAKRWGEGRGGGPLLGSGVPGVGGRDKRWVRAHPAQARDTVLAPGAAEALRALPDLAAEIEDDPGEPAWAAELLAFEVLSAGAAESASRRNETRFAIHEIAAEL